MCMDPVGARFLEPGFEKSDALGEPLIEATGNGESQFEMSVTFASALHVEQNGTRCCFVD
jgi:hypothetical protein